MWERKKLNHEKRMQKERASAGGSVGSGDDGDDNFQGTGASVKKSDILKAKTGTKQKNR